MSSSLVATPQLTTRSPRLEEGAPGRSDSQGDELVAPASPDAAGSGAADSVPVAAPTASSPAVGPAPFAGPPPGSGEGVNAIYVAFEGSPGLAWALRVAYCESRYNPRAVNAASGASGLFQFMPSTWNAYFPGWNIWDPSAQARAARVFYDKGWTNAWVCK